MARGTRCIPWVLGLAAAAAHAQTVDCGSGFESPPLALRFERKADTAPALAALTGVPERPDPLAPWSAQLDRALQDNPALQAAGRNLLAADQDLAEVRGGRLPQLSLSGGLQAVRSAADGASESTPARASVGLSVSAPLFDGGRLDQLEAWRNLLRDAAALAREDARENLVLDTVLNGLERERHALQALVFGRYEVQMTCLSQSLERIVREDRGRASELVQARKSLNQAQIAREESQARVRQLEIQLRRLLGGSSPLAYGLGLHLAGAPEPGAGIAFVEQAPLVRQLEAETRAQRAFAQSLLSQRSSQLYWVASGSNSRAAGGSAGAFNGSSWQAGVSWSKSLDLGRTIDAAYRAAMARADAAGMRREQLVAERTARAGELAEQAGSSWTRARSYAPVLRDSDQVRRNTLQLWSLLGRRSLFDVMAAESEHYALRAAFVNAVFVALQAQAQQLALGGRLGDWARAACHGPGAAPCP